jgi:DNA-binding transcriptional MerR regulator
MVEASSRSAAAFRTIGDVAAELNLPQHILRYWETRFPQLRPLQRAGNRRYYRPADVDLVRRIDRLLNREGYTVRGVRQLLDGGQADMPVDTIASPSAAPARRSDLLSLRTMLLHALAEDERG